MNGSKIECKKGQRGKREEYERQKQLNKQR
jgi:hypothetical protein